MLGLPRSTELNRQIPKKSIFAKFGMSEADKSRFNADIKKLVISNEISPSSVNIASGESVSSFYVVLAVLRNEDFDSKNIVMLSKLINHNMLFVLECESRARLAVFRSRLMLSGWAPLEELKISLDGLDLDAVWQNIIVQIGGVEIEQGNTLDEQIALDEERSKLQRQIERLERRAWNEKQPRKKFELAQEVKALLERLKKSGWQS